MTPLCPIITTARTLTELFFTAKLHITKSIAHKLLEGVVYTYTGQRMAWQLSVMLLSDQSC